MNTDRLAALTLGASAHEAAHASAHEAAFDAALEARTDAAAETVLVDSIRESFEADMKVQRARIVDALRSAGIPCEPHSNTPFGIALHPANRREARKITMSLRKHGRRLGLAPTAVAITPTPGKRLQTPAAR